MHVQCADSLPSTSEELQVLGDNIRRLTISNESLSQSNKTLTDILCSQQQSSNSKSNPANTSATSPTEAQSANASATSSTKALTVDVATDTPLIALDAVPHSPKIDPVMPAKPASHNSTHDHLQRCMDSVQELAKTIACAMSAW